MIKFGNKVIDEDITVILKRLKEYLHKNGIERFRNMQNIGNYVMTNCPIHKEGQERNPSCGILRVQEGEKPAGLVHCFACGYAKTFDVMVSDLFGRNDKGEFGRQWLLDNFVNYEDETRRFELNLERDKKPPEISFVSEEELDKYRYSHPYWAKRKIDEKTCIKFDLGYDIENKSITMPVWDMYGRCIGITRRRVDRKAFHIPEGMLKPVYLLNFAIKEQWKTIYLCESQINALYLNALGYTACACFGTGTEQQADDIKKSGVRSIVFCFDGDDAGRKGRKKMYERLNERVICSYVDLPEGKDVNDLSPEEVRNLLSETKNF